MDLQQEKNRLLFIDGDLVMIGDFLTGVAQRLTIRLRSHKYKWFLADNYGVDYFGKIFGKVKSKTKIDLIIRDEVMKDKYVDKITYFRSEVTNDRKYNCTIRLKIKSIKREQELRVLTTEYGFAILTEENRYILV